MTAYYNEIDPYAAQWLRNLIEAGHIAPGVVDTRSIADVRPADLRGFTQCHFFAGIGIWSYALRRAGWPDDRCVWTGSCPCQPFSSAGKGGGFSDERHLWPAWLHLIDQRRPPVVFGEQVASKDTGPWIDLVHDDMEVLDYAFGAIPFPAAGVGAPHIRDRLYWVAHAEHGRRKIGEPARRWTGATLSSGTPCLMGHADEGRSGRHTGTVPGAQSSVERNVRGITDGAQPTGTASTLADDEGSGRFGLGGLRVSGQHFHDVEGRSPVSGFWAGADWIACRDDKWRAVEPGTFPLAHGATSRVGRLRAYGNAIVAPAAIEFIGAAMVSGVGQ